MRLFLIAMLMTVGCQDGGDDPPAATTDATVAVGDSGSLQTGPDLTPDVVQALDATADVDEEEEWPLQLATIKCGMLDTVDVNTCFYGGYCDAGPPVGDQPAPYGEVASVVCCPEGPACTVEQALEVGQWPKPIDNGENWQTNPDADESDPCHKVAMALRTFTWGLGKGRAQYAQLRIVGADGYTKCPVAEVEINGEFWPDGKPSHYAFDTAETMISGFQDDGDMRHVWARFYDERYCGEGQPSNRSGGSGRICGLVYTFPTLDPATEDDGG